MSKYQEKAAKTLAEAKQMAACQHRPESRGIDLDTADEFCIDCGAVTEEYEPRMERRFPGRQASDLIVAELKKEFQNQMVQTSLLYVEPVDKDEFNVLMEVRAKHGGGFRQYRLVRSDSGVTVTLIGGKK